MGLNSDESIKKLKGPKRPIHQLEDRVLMLSELESVSYVMPFEEETPLKLVMLLKPHILVKGGDYKLKDIVGATVMNKWNGLVRVYPIEFGHSTTSIIEKLSVD